ncbi:hypothetical protein PF010_g4259 [Phytophthora fragariae]|uniref:ZSWIM1/3 RNaseH-like domain-containing protein n=2 Tax=Phytophthora fragariae TaxID=53985 RepID=A0A6A3LW17_9STRA|nr:hypothetical protein PF003_g18695 [Phytophthora fragariae]KAE8944939.1 hypothetical protein PF009_g5398 [Phytophthora fragariae]KAE9022288.1 hypothetical protein PF011_g4535 [Phytophthora fragariae]KAE9129094.1 hypothetical protein PF010_g4259 [Phytophthora fragariae]KAE9129330.1 hypothetical protein PF007_g4913 [Phytophthora fragariae]
MVHDAFGKGQFVQHAVLQNERAATLMTAIEEFKKPWQFPTARGSIVADAEPHPFEIYFRKNWDKCKVMWTAHERQSAVTLGNNTNNRLESSLKHLKDTISSFMGLDECVAAIICYQSRTEWAFEAKVSKIGVVHDPKFDREISLVASLVSRHACDLIFDQYAYAMSATAL